MKRFTIIGLSIFCLSLAVTTSVKAENRVEHLAKLETVISKNIEAEISPFELVARGYQGAYRKHGISGFTTFMSDITSKKITPRSLVRAAIAANHLAAETQNDLEYLQAVDFLLLDKKL
jgi:hypothetical protein